MRARAESVASFQAWNDDEDPWDEYLRIRREQEKRWDDVAGEALKDALRHMRVGKTSEEFVSGDFAFYCGDDFDLTMPRLPLQPLRPEKRYPCGLSIVSVADQVENGVLRVITFLSDQLDDSLAERTFDGYLWRLALDAVPSAHTYEQIFIEGYAHRNDPWTYMLASTSTIKQHRYPKLGEDCIVLAEQYAVAARSAPELLIP